MVETPSQLKARKLGPYSRVLTRGAIGGEVDGRSREGRFLRQTEVELLAQLGREPNFTEKLLIRRVCKMMLLAEKLDDKLTGGGEWTSHDARTFGGLNNALRVALRDLGLKQEPKAKPASLADIAARHAKPKAAAE